MNQSMLQIETLMREQARDRERHVAEGRILRALDARAADRSRAQESLPTAGGNGPSGLLARFGQLGRGVRLPAQLRTPGPLCADSPL